MSSGAATVSTNEQPVVSLDGVTVRYGDAVVLDNVSFTAGPGQLIGVRGVNGSGKTTLLRLLANAYRPSSGRRVGPSRCAYVPGTITPPSLRAQAWLHGMPRPHGDPGSAVGPALAEMGFDGDLTASCRALSFGNLRKMLLVEAFTSGERLLILDEASAGLDDRGVAGLASMIARALATGRTIVLADQDSRPIPQASRLVRVDAGSVVDVAVERLGPAPPSVETEITLRGPQARLAELLAVAKGHGFTRTGEGR